MKHVYAIYRQPDLSEGRAAHVRDLALYEDEQEAWDLINDLPGVQGSKPPNCWPREKLREAGATTWQDYARVMGRGGDYYVAPIPIIPAKSKDPHESIEDRLRSLVAVANHDPSYVGKSITVFAPLLIDAAAEIEKLRREILDNQAKDL